MHFGDVQVRLKERQPEWKWGKWRVWGRHHLFWERRYPDAPKETGTLVYIYDWDTEWGEMHGADPRWLREFVQFAFIDERNGIMGRYLPPLERIGNEPFFLHVRVHMHKQWIGQLALYLPVGTRQRKWHFLPLAAVDSSAQVRPPHEATWPAIGDSRAE